MPLLPPAAPRRPDPAPLELNDSHVVALGTLLWLVGLVVLAAVDLLGADVPGWQLVMCGCGVALGVAGLRYIAKRRRRH